MEIIKLSNQEIVYKSRYSGVYNKNDFLRGFLYIDDKEYIVNDYN